MEDMIIYSHKSAHLLKKQKTPANSIKKAESNKKEKYKKM
jgi:hypothetical protein